MRLAGQWFAVLILYGAVPSLLAAEGATTWAQPALAAPRLEIKDIAGVYAVRQDKPFDPRIYDLHIAGVSLRTYWRNVEPQRDQFNWSLFDDAIKQCAARGKKVRLCIMFGLGVPKWVGAKWFTGSPDSEYDTANKPLPVPWDSNLLREQQRINRIFAERYRDNPHVAFFHISGPSSIWEELALPKNIVEQEGYSQQRILACWKQMIEQWKQIRGNKRLSVAVSAATSVYRRLGDDIGAYAVGDPKDPNDHGVVGPDFCLQWNYLDTLYAPSILDRSRLWLPKTVIAWQMWGSTQWSRKCQDYQGSVQLAMDVGATYIEIYQEDLLIPELAAFSENIHKELKARIQQHGKPTIMLRELPPKPGTKPAREQPQGLSKAVQSEAKDSVHQATGHRQDQHPGSDNAGLVCGTWALQQAGSVAELEAFRAKWIDAALRTPHLRGFCLRVPWKAIDKDFSLLEAGLKIARQHNLDFSLRFMAGRHTPAWVFDKGCPFYTKRSQEEGVEKVPAPFTPDGSPNAIFEEHYEALVARLAAWCRKNQVHLLHLAWYGQDWAELNHGKEVRALPGYSFDNWLGAHKRLIDIGLKYAGDGLAVELPFSGYGPCAAAATMFADHVIDRVGQSRPLFFCQANGWGPNGDWGAPNRDTEAAFDKVWTRPICRGQQMIQPRDYDWPRVFEKLYQNKATYCEVYTPSFTMEHKAQLAEEIRKLAEHCKQKTPLP
jgi:hypothetical protein